ncbi:DUF3761 domain-containing protein [Candidatus Mycobacterium methanotrophicum]|uniref:DUF3761 domain-containing protein n=1 Tax=Candidatus Mycobacterium methanotrophicum TaxID=2943498 RepID=A0ABY4QKD8_9MYCO|nr:DUF3761 domain-containing protein [Candidatus Mycobacterium methanotrophicum]UQX10263.1 DUF3761 domain-containing protein [Candidatus Mycobacterium methanotrophicum]
MLLRVATLVAVAIASAVIGSTSPANAVMQCSKGYYKAASGDCVHRPVCGVPSPPPGATAKCADGCYTFSETLDGDSTCHGHGGVA